MICDRIIGFLHYIMNVSFRSNYHQGTIRCSVTAITSRSHRGDRGSTPRFGVSFLFSRKIHMLIHLPLLFHCDATSHILLISIFFLLLFALPQHTMGINSTSCCVHFSSSYTYNVNKLAWKNSRSHINAWNMEVCRMFYK